MHDVTIVLRSRLLRSLIMVLATLMPVSMISGYEAHIRPLTMRHSEIGRALDKYYYDAGTRVDIAAFDLRELERQGETVDTAIIREIDHLDKEMRAKWLELDNRREQIRQAIFSVPPAGTHVLAIQSLEDGPASEVGWFGLRSAKFVFADERSVDIPLRSFQNAVYRGRYSHRVEPSPTVFVYGKQALQNIMSAGFEVDPLPDENFELVISGLDCDKPGVVSIRIKVNGHLVFEGPNPFEKDEWSEHAFAVPADVLREDSAIEVATGDMILAQLDALKVEVDKFGVWALSEADEIDDLTSGLRANLVYEPLDLPDDWWKKHFIRGMCFRSDHGRTEPRHRGTTPWYYDDFEYTAKAFRDAGVNLAYLYPYTPLMPELYKELDKVGIPNVTVALQLKRARYYSDRERLMDETKEYFTNISEGHPSVAGIAIDEPTIREGGRAEDDITKSTKVLEAFGEYLAARDLPASVSNTPVLKIENENDLVSWMEWQMFKKEFMGDHFEWYAEESDRLGIWMFTIIMNWNRHQPQGCSYVSMGRLPLISTDLYNDGVLHEGFAMQLLNNAAKGKSVMTPGSGYSCKTPARFRRSLAVSMAHSEGSLQWIHTYASKYRNLRFWRSEGKWRDADDRGRDALSNWSPDYWDIQLDMFDKMKQADEYLVDVDSAARIVVLHSERTAIHASRPRRADEEASGDFFPPIYVNENEGAYSALIGLNRPVDVRFVESISGDVMKQYDVAILSNARVMTPAETGIIREWVKSGGTLIASANTSLHDEWGRQQKDFALSDIFGAHFEKVVDTPPDSGFHVKGIDVLYQAAYPYSRVKPNGADIKARWGNDDPALLHNEAGAGQAWLLTLQQPFIRGGHPSPEVALNTLENKGMADLLRKLVSRSLDDEEVMILNAPEELEVVVRRKGDALVVHLLDWHDEREISGLELKITRGAPRRVFSAFSGMEIPFDDTAGTAVIPPVKLYKIIVVKR